MVTCGFAGGLLVGYLLDLLLRSWYMARLAHQLLVVLLVRLWGAVLVVTRKALFCGARRRPRVLRVWVGGIRFDLQYRRRTGWLLLAWAYLERRLGVRRARTVGIPVVPKKPDQTASKPGEVRRPLPVPHWLSKTPILASYLLDLDYEDGGGPREQSYYTVRPTRTGWDVTLKDPGTCRQLRVTVVDMGTMFAALEALLSSAVCPWEDDQWALARQPKKKK